MNEIDKAKEYKEGKIKKALTVAELSTAIALLSDKIDAQKNYHPVVVPNLKGGKGKAIFN